MFDISIDNQIIMFDQYNVNKVGLVLFQNETITDCWVQNTTITGIIRATTSENYLSFIIKDSKFNNNTGNLAYMDSASIYVDNCVFDSKMDDQIIAFRDLIVTDYFNETEDAMYSKTVDASKTEYISLEYLEAWSEDIGCNKVLYSIDSSNHWKKKFSNTSSLEENQDQLTTLYFNNATTIDELFAGFDADDLEMHLSS